MSYGFDIRNRQGKSLILGREKTYLFGRRERFDMWINAGQHQAKSFVLNVSPWGNCIAFATFDAPKANGLAFYVRLQKKKTMFSTQWVVEYGGRSFGVRYRISGWIFVFAEASEIPLPRYGLLLMNSSNETAFHTGSPALKVRGFSQQPGHPGNIGLVRMSDQRSDWETMAYSVGSAVSGYAWAGEWRTNPMAANQFIKINRHDYMNHRNLI